MKKQLEAIRAIDPKAAEYIENEVFPRYDFEKDKRFKKSKLPWKKKKKRDILTLFIWELTPQGRYYWFNIWSKLNG